MLYQSQQKRSGMILLIVLALLSLFSIVGLSFVFYADAEAVASQAFNESLIGTRADADPEVLMAYFLGQFLYDVPDTSAGVYSAMRGHSLARSMHGYNSAALNFTPYNGVGRDALGYPVPVGAGAVDNRFCVNYQKYDNSPGDPFGGAQRNPEYFGKAGDANFRFVGGANPPWTSYDINNMFLAEVQADGTVLMPSFYRPWLASSLAALPPADQAKVAKYMSLQPDKFWNPGFATPLPDADAMGDVKNLDFGPGGNDSKWMDLGFPIMTAPNGKRYKPLFAPLILDLSNRIHLWAHGNMRGGTNANSPSHVSNHGLGATEVNVTLRLPRVSAAIMQHAEPATNPTGASAVGTTVTIQTMTPHGFLPGDRVIIAGVREQGYNGTFTVLNAPAPTATTFSYTAGFNGLPRSGYGTVTNAEFTQLFNLKYGGATTPAGTAITFPTGPGRGGLPPSLLNFDGRGVLDAVNYEQGVSSRPMHSTFVTQLQNPVVIGATSLTLTATFGQSYGGFHWSIYPGMVLSLDSDVNAEVVTVQNVNYATNVVMLGAGTTKAHVPGAPVTPLDALPTKGFPTYPINSYLNLNATEIAGHPMNLNLFASIGNNPLPSITTMEALLRYRHTNGPAVTSEVFRRMPQTFMSLRARNVYTTVNWNLDRIGSSPSLTFDRNVTANQYIYNAAVRHPQLAINPPAPAAYGTPTPLPNSEFTQEPGVNNPGWRSTLSQRLRLDLNRRLTDYPAVAVGVITLPDVQYTTALTERQTFAKDIYYALLAVTGARDPNNPATLPAMLNTSTEYQAARWLAQLAVNIVDFIDADDYNTPFNWHPAGVNEWVFGTELPRLVLNEVYAQREQTDNHIHVWAELLNPYSANTTALPNNNGAAILQYADAATAAPPYKIDILATSPTLSAFLRDPANNMGDPGTSVVLSSQTDWGGTTSAGPGTAPLAMTRSVLPSSGALFGGTTVVCPIAVETADPLTSGASANVNLVTIRTTAPAPNNFASFSVGQAVTITGVQSTANATAAVGYEGTYVITSKNAANTAITIECPTPNLPLGGGGTASVRVNGNQGYYVIGPAGARYPSAARNPQFPATYVSPTAPGAGMAVPLTLVTPPILIADPTVPGVSMTQDATTLVWTATVTTTVDHNLKDGDNVVLQGVIPAPAGQGNFNRLWTNIKVTTPTTFTFVVPAAYAATITPPPPNYGNGTVQVAPPPVTVLLRRLANPHLPAQFVPTAPNYNPYITIDYVDGIEVKAIDPTAPVSQFASVGRKQPYAAFNNQAVPLQSEIVAHTQPVPNQPANTMFSQNVMPPTPPAPFDWLVHLDRPLINPLELLHVSGYKPHELTQQFKAPVSTPPVSTPFLHLAPWSDQASMLYRFLELAGTANHMAGTINGGRHPGKININTITDLEVFLALCDPQDHNQPNPLFNTAQVSALFANLVASRNGGAPGPGAAPQNDGKPFKPLSAGNIGDTIFRPDATGQPLFALPGSNGTQHPYHRAALMQKIYNNITTTSNCFAVWVTVGFFEVVDETVRPARLGAEIGRDQNRHVRHRFFSIVDRTALELYRGTTAGAINVVAANPLPQAGTLMYDPASISLMGGTTQVWVGTRNYEPGDTVAVGATVYICTQANINAPPATSPLAWQDVLQPGMLVEITSPAGVSEVVTVKAVAANSFTADFNFSFPAGSRIVVRGNPGPRPAYSPRKDTNVVLHTSLIQ